MLLQGYMQYQITEINICEVFFSQSGTLPTAPHRATNIAHISEINEHSQYHILQQQNKKCNGQNKVHKE